LLACTTLGDSPELLISEKEFFIDNLLVRIHFIIVMIRWTGLAPWEFKSPFPGSLASLISEFMREYSPFWPARAITSERERARVREKERDIEKERERERARESERETER